MATRFELVLHGQDPVRLRAAGEEALAEIERLDAQLSLYRPDSEVSRINRLGAREPVWVERWLFELVQQAVNVSRATHGAFDITIAPLIRAWGLASGGGRVPEEPDLSAARDRVGYHRLILDEQRSTIAFDRPGVEVDLGAIGKGYAVERAVESLVENGVSSALIHGGTSSIHAVGSPPDQAAWRVGIARPEKDKIIRTIDLNDSSLSVSSVSGKSFCAHGQEYGHVLDPRAGCPVSGAALAAVTGPSATLCDAVSTALLVLGDAGLPLLSERFPQYHGFVFPQGEGSGDPAA